MRGHEIATTHHPGNVVVACAELTQLPARDHAILHADEEVFELIYVEAGRFAALA